MAKKWTEHALSLGCGFGLVVLAIMLFLPNVTPVRGRRPPCQINLKQIVLSLKMYSNETRGELYPAISAEPGRLMFELEDIYPEYLSIPTFMICPSGDDAGEMLDYIEKDYYYRASEGYAPEDFIDDRSYFYLGYAIQNDDEMQAFAKEYLVHAESGARMTDDILVSLGNRSMRLRRLREGVERFLIPPELRDDPGVLATKSSQIPILIERLGNHSIAGANVAYLDGHVEFVAYPGKWPMTETTVRILNELDALGGVNRN